MPTTADVVTRETMQLPEIYATFQDWRNVTLPFSYFPDLTKSRDQRLARKSSSQFNRPQPPVPKLILLNSKHPYFFVNLVGLSL